MKISFKYKKIISCFIILPSIFLFVPQQKNNLEADSFRRSSFGISEQNKYIGYSIEQVSLGKLHSTAVITNGSDESLYAWGDNRHRQCGIEVFGFSEQYDAPEELTNLTKGNIEDISTGADNSGAVVDNELYTWGENGHGQLGFDFHNSTLDISVPWPVPLKEGTIEQISFGFKHSAAVLNYIDNDNGDTEATDHLYTWGNNISGQLGLGYYANDKNDGEGYLPYISDPQLVPFFDEDEFNIEQIAMGNDYSAALINKGNNDILYTWGKNDKGQLGLGNDRNELTYNTPQEVILLPDGNIEQIWLGYSHSAAVINKSGTDELYTWGSNNYGQLGLGDNNNENSYNTPQKVSGLPNGDIQQIAMGNDYSAAVINDGTSDHLYTWGKNEYGQLGLGNAVAYNTPQEVTKLPEGDIEQISLGGMHSAAIVKEKDGDHLYTWGSNEYGQLGYGGNYKKDVNYVGNIPYYNIPHQIFSEIYSNWFFKHWYYFLFLIIAIIFIYILIVVWIVKSKKIAIFTDK